MSSLITQWLAEAKKVPRAQGKYVPVTSKNLTDADIANHVENVNGEQVIRSWNKCMHPEQFSHLLDDQAEMQAALEHYKRHKYLYDQCYRNHHYQTKIADANKAKRRKIAEEKKVPQVTYTLNEWIDKVKGYTSSSHRPEECFIVPSSFDWAYKGEYPMLDNESHEEYMTRIAPAIAATHKEDGLDYDIHALDDNKMRIWSKELDPARLKFADIDDQTNAHAIFTKHNTVFNTIRKRQKYDPEAVRRAGREKHANLSKEAKKRIGARNQVNKQKRRDVLKANGLRKCEFAGCQKIYPLSEFTYAAADAGCSDYQQGNRVAKQVKIQKVCQQCFPTYMERVRERDSDRIRKKHVMTDAQKAAKAKRYKETNLLYPERRVKMYAEKRGGVMNLTDDEAHQLLTAPQCTYCQRVGVKMTIDRVIPNGPYAMDNCVSACWDCNMAKGIHDKDEFYRLCDNVTNKQKHSKNTTVAVNQYYSHDFKAQGRPSMATTYQWHRLRKNKILLTEEKFDQIVSRGCFFCGLQSTNRIGLDKINYNGIYEEDNVLPACTACNMAKKRLSVSEFVRLTEAVSNNANKP